METLIIRFPDGSDEGTVTRVRDTAPGGPKMVIDNGDGTYSLPRTRHAFAAPADGEGIMAYYIRMMDASNLPSFNAGSIREFLGGEDARSLVPANQQGNKATWPLLIDAFVWPEAYFGPNLGGTGGSNQSVLQPGALDVRAMNVAQLEGLMLNISDTLRHPESYGPTSAVHELSQLMHASGIRDDGTGHIVPPASFPQLAVLTVEQAKDLMGRAR